MDQIKIGKFIKEIRLKNKMTQKELADKLQVTYQAVSKWENGKNIPDIAVLQQISKLFNVELTDILEGKKQIKNKKKWPFLIIVLLLLVLGICLIFCLDNDKVKFKTISTTCEDFKITGLTAYNKNKGQIYISNIDYCGPKDETTYQNIECTLYEEDKNTLIKISSAEDHNQNLEDFLNKVQFNIDDYSPSCKSFQDSKIFLEIRAWNDSSNMTSLNVPIELKDC